MKNQTLRPQALTSLSILILAATIITGCVVNSIYPFYTAKDLTFDPALLGTWRDASDSGTNEQESWQFEKIAGQTYKLTIRGTGETNAFDTHLFALGKERFLDCLPRQRAAYHAPQHFLLRVKRVTPTLELQLLDYGWLSKLVEQNPKAIRHIVVPKEVGTSNDGGELTLTADPAELQKFIRKHLHETNAWVAPIVMKKH